MDKILFIFLTILVASVVNAKKDFSNFKVYNVVPKNSDDIGYLKAINNIGGVEIWDDQVTINSQTKVMVPPTKQEEIETIFKAKEMWLGVAIEDVQRAIDNQLASSVRSARNTDAFDFETYNDLDQIYQWLDHLAETYPNIVNTFVIGTSVEGREIKGIVMNFHPERTDKLIGVFEGTCHAREWISPATIAWIINEFLTSTDDGIRTFAETFEWHFIPVMNPDGYAYTFSTNRLWRKNRSPASNTTCAEGVEDDMSNGVDLNRNFDFQWMTVGATDDPCSNTFAGPTMFSEPETRALANYVLSLNQQGTLTYYFSIHSYSQLMLVPYSHTSGNDLLQSGNYGDMFEVASRASAVIEQNHGTVYSAGPSSELMYEMSGTSFDWVKFNTQVPFAYLFELRDLGTFGFLLPVEQILPTGQEIVEGLVEMDRAARGLGYYVSYSNGAGIAGSLLAVAVGVFVVMLQ